MLLTSAVACMDSTPHSPGAWWLQKVALGSAHLEEALCLLKDAGQPPVSPILEQEIQEALADFKPDCTLEHLKVVTNGAAPIPCIFPAFLTTSCHLVEKLFFYTDQPGRKL